MIKPLRIVFLGPPGSGKDTQAEVLVKELGLTSIDAGTQLRRVAQENTARGREVAELIDNGHLAPIHLTVEIIKEEIVKVGEGGFILIGFPRNLEQAQLLGAAGLTHAIDIEIDDAICMQRIKSRLVSNPGQARADDKSDAAIQQRLDVYHTNHPPLEDFYRQMGILHQVDGVPPIADIHQVIRDILGLSKEEWHKVG